MSELENFFKWIKCYLLCYKIFYSWEVLFVVQERFFPVSFLVIRNCIKLTVIEASTTRCTVRNISFFSKTFKVNNLTEPFKCQSQKTVKHTETICREIADELFEWVWPFCGIGAKRVNFLIWIKVFIIQLPRYNYGKTPKKLIFTAMWLASHYLENEQMFISSNFKRYRLKPLLQPKYRYKSFDATSDYHENMLHMSPAKLHKVWWRPRTVKRPGSKLFHIKLEVFYRKSCH